MKQSFTLLAFGLFFILKGLAQSNMQNLVYEWAHSFGSTTEDRGKGIVNDAFGNVYTTGYFKGTFDFDPGVGIYNLSATGGSDIFIQKLDSNGAFIWAIKMSGSSQEYSYAIDIDTMGNVYITGHFAGTVDFDPGIGTMNLTSNGTSDIYVAKVATSGNLLWAKQMGGPQYDTALDLAVDDMGNVFTTGLFMNTVDFDPGINTTMFTSNGLYDIFIQKLDPNGDLVWVKHIGGTGNDEGISITLSISGEIHVTGMFSNTVDFDPGIGVTSYVTSGVNDAYILKLDSLGDLIWVKQCSGYYYAGGSSIGTDKLGNVYTTGYFDYYIDLDPDTSSYILNAVGSIDIFIQKLDVNGDFQWAKAIGGTNSDRVNDVKIDTSGNVYFGGYFFGTVDFDGGIDTFLITCFGPNDAFLEKMDTDGNFLWAKHFGGTGGPELDAMSLYEDYVYITGSLNDTVDFDPNLGVVNLIDNGVTDFYVAKYKQCLNSDSTLILTICDSVTLNGQTFTISGIYTQIFPNATGCDSILTLDITIFASSSANIILIDCDSITVNNQLYTLTGIYTQTLTNAVGCDSLLTIDITINNNYINTYITTCNNYLWNGQLLDSSGTYIQVYPNINGCDSILSLFLTILDSSSKNLSLIACDSITINNQTYLNSGIYTQLLTNSVGCDSLLTLDLTIHPSSTSFIITTDCNDYTLNGQTYTASGNYVQHILNYLGCDSIISLNITINQSTNQSITDSSCYSYTLNNQTYTSSGIYTQTLINAVGCDSTLILNLSIYSPTAGITQNGNVLTASLANVYQWIDCTTMSPILGANNQSYSPSMNGSYAVIILQNNCSDTSICYPVTIIGIEENLPSLDISLYPNPTADFVQIDLNREYNDVSIICTDITGKIIDKQDFINRDNLIYHLPFSAGVYLLIIRAENELKVMKVLKY